MISFAPVHLIPMATRPKFQVLHKVVLYDIGLRIADELYYRIY